MAKLSKMAQAKRKLKFPVRREKIPRELGAKEKARREKRAAAAK